MKRIRSKEHRLQQKAYWTREDVKLRAKQRREALTGEKRIVYLTRMRVRQLKAKYGLTAIGFLALVKYQENQCAICRVDLSTTGTWVDHDHETGKVRGALCPRCNTFAGPNQNHIAFLQKVITYIKES